MKNREKLHAKYYFIPCWYNQLTDEVWGKNTFWNVLLSIALWFDTYILMKEEFELWVEDWNE